VKRLPCAAGLAFIPQLPQALDIGKNVREILLLPSPATARRVQASCKYLR
jgi:hypothetical protein